MRNALPVFVGYDSREDIAYLVCKFSILSQARTPVFVQPLAQDALRSAGLFTRRSTLTKDGFQVDASDGKPFSTEFAFTRFLVPALMQYQGWAVFCDCDFLFTQDITNVFDHISEEDERKAVYVVQHRHIPIEYEKMDHQPQTVYRRKNWSSFMVLNCGHPAHRRLTVDAVNTEPGAWLHGFDWLRDEEIGALPLTWNFLSGVNEWQPNQGRPPAGIHFTLGGPWFEECQDVPYSRLWIRERNMMQGSAT